jgi:hypothetical protein
LKTEVKIIRTDLSIHLKIDIGDLVSITISNKKLTYKELKRIFGDLKYYYFIKRNISKITEIVKCDDDGVIKTYSLKNGFLHSITGPALIIIYPHTFRHHDRIIEKYYIDGFHCSFDDWNIKMRKFKIENIFNKISKKACLS